MLLAYNLMRNIPLSLGVSGRGPRRLPRYSILPLRTKNSASSAETSIVTRYDYVLTYAEAIFLDPYDRCIGCYNPGIVSTCAMMCDAEATESMRQLPERRSGHICAWKGRRDQESISIPRNGTVQLSKTRSRRATSAQSSCHVGATQRRAGLIAGW